MEFDFERLENDFLQENLDKLYQPLTTLESVEEMVALQKKK